MVQPINYMLDVQNPIQTAMTGLTQGMQIGQFMQAKEQAEREAIQKQQMQEELSAFASKPNKTHDDYANIMAKYPSLAEDFKRSYDVLDSGKQQATFKTTSRIYAALSGGQPSVAKSILETEALGYENAGDKTTADQMRTLAAMAETDPDGLLTISGLTLASTTPSQFKDVLGALGENQKLPEEINLTKAQTEKTNTETLWYGDKTQAEIDNLESQVEDRKTGRVLQQQEMQLQNDQFYAKLDQDQQQFYENLNQEERKLAQTVFNVREKPEQRMERLEKVNKFASASQNAANTAKLAAEIANDPYLSYYTGGYWNKVMRSLPGTNEYNFHQKVKTLESQAFLIGAEGLKGLGAMTETEGAKVTVALANLNPSQDPGEFQKQLSALAKAASSVSTTASKNAQIYATKGKGYSAEVVEAAKARGVSPAEMQQIANQLGIE
jgi:hypothetical protein